MQRSRAVCPAIAIVCLLPAALLEHDPEKWNQFSDKIMRNEKIMLKPDSTKLGQTSNSGITSENLKGRP